MPTDIDRDEVQRLPAPGAQLVDVLPPKEYAEQRLAGAIRIPLKQMDATSTGALRRDRCVVVYCHDYQWDMSARAAWRLESLGFTRVCRDTAGKSDWLANGLPSEGTNANPTTVATVARRAVPTCRLGERVGDVARRLAETGFDRCVVVNDDNVVLGLAYKDDLGASSETPIVPVMREGPTTYRLNGPAEGSARHLKERKIESVLVTTSDGVLVGIFSSADDGEKPSHRGASADAPANADPC